MVPPSQWNKPPRRQQSCANCNVFAPNPGANPQADEPRQGWCRAQPPAMMPVMVQAPGSALSPKGPQMTQAMWPPTNTSAWCRAWESLEDDDGGIKGGSA